MPTATATAFDHLILEARRTAGAVALVGPDGQLTYAELAAAVERRIAELALPTRSVVVLAGANSIDWVVTYLALMAGGHVPLLAGARVDRIVERWAPAAVVSADVTGWRVERCAADAGQTPDLHTDLALLMTTSGSTGDPKLVRLSHDNLVANATSIARFQDLTAADRGITNLPLHYSFGLSVLHSHLVAGASVVVTDNSVVDACFARALRDHDVTNVAGVPYTYELVDQVGPERLRGPAVRFLAQAGGRMDPDRVATWADLARSWGVQWYSMYGQTEATARMSYVPPDLVHDHPDAIGIAIPDGELTVETYDDEVPVPVATGEIGEIVYRGPNVMLGYADTIDDLAAGATLAELRTGDLGRVEPGTGLLSVVGRRARRVKPFGLRIDLDDVERQLAATGHGARVSGDDELVVVASTCDAATVLARTAEITGLPETRVRVIPEDAPRTANGKVDYAALLERGHAQSASEPSVEPAADDAERALIAAYALVLGRRDVVPTDSFVSLGGDSLSYVECSVRAERVVGQLPGDWHLMPIGELAGRAHRRRVAWLDTTALLRAIAILAVVATHMRLRFVPGGSHLMLGVVGYNVARFLLEIEPTSARLRAGARTILRVAVPTIAWTLAFMVVGQYTWTTLTLANNYVGPSSHRENHWHFWFIEVMVHLIAVTILVTAIPVVRRLDLRFPYAFPLALLAAALTLRMDWADLGDWYNLRFRTHSVAWFFVLGWLVQRSSTLPKRIATTVVCVATVLGFFNHPERELFIATGLVVLVWAKAIPWPRFAVRPVAVLAEATLWIYLSHFMIWPPMKRALPVEIAFVLTIAAALGVWWLATRAPRLLGARFPRSLPTRSPSPHAAPAAINAF